MKRTLTALSLTLALAAPAAAADADIVDTAVAAGSFTTLAAALGAAGLVDTLKGDGPFTVYAPTDAAFAALPPGTVETLLKPENKDQLIAILTYHVSPGKLMAKQVARKDMVDTVNGDMVDVTVNADGTVNLDEAFIIDTDIVTSNGIIHVIDRVMIPDGK
jgi:uncharacterized surface protein with fasciclin (FAS1) repeats